MNVRFEEKQSLPKLLIPAVLIPTLVIWFIGLLQGISEKPVGNHPMSDSDMWIMVIALGIILPMIILTTRGRIVVTEESLTLTLFPFFRKKVQLTDIVSVQLAESRPFNELQSWGVKYRHGTLRFVLQGQTGLTLNLTNGHKIFMTCIACRELLQVLESSSQSSPLIP